MSTTFGALALAADARPVATDYLVVGASVDDLAARGLATVDDYGTGVTARLAPSDVAALEAAGFKLVPVPHAFGRGAFVADSDADVPADLRASPDSAFAIVQFRGPVKAEWRATLESNARVYDYLPHHAFLVRLAPGARDVLAALPEVRAVVPYHPAYKLSTELPATGAVDATALAYLDEPLAAVLASLALVGATPTAWATTSLEHVIDFTADASALAAVAKLDAVAWVEPAYDEGSLDNSMASAITQSGGVGQYTLHEKGVTGSSQKASVCDTGADTSQATPGIPGLFPATMRMVHEMHDDSQRLLIYNAHITPAPITFPHDKIDLYYSPQEGGSNRGDSDDSDGHGTHTAGTIAGNAPAYGSRNNHDGVAYAAKLLICDITQGSSFQILNDYSNYWKPAYDRGARVNSNSWGSSHTTQYTEKARQHDAYVWEHRDFLILRSMGNIASTIRPEAVAKSAMGIGAGGNGASTMENVASFSGVGPTADGRLKPNVFAPGDCLTSSYRGGATSYQCLSGTSMSTPTVAGAATLVLDYFKKGFYPTGTNVSANERTITSAMLRAILQVSAKDATGNRASSAIPNNVEGWGRVLLDDALYFAGDSKKLLLLDDEATSLATGGSKSYTVTVAAGQPLRVMLAWSDAPGAAGANPAIVNNLDLKVTGPLGTYVGNAFSGGQVSPGTGSPDTKNVEEAVYITAPVAGTYTVTVTGTNVPSGPQPYALVATGGVS